MKINENFRSLKKNRRQLSCFKMHSFLNSTSKTQRKIIKKSSTINFFSHVKQKKKKKRSSSKKQNTNATRGGSEKKKLHRTKTACCDVLLHFKQTNMHAHQKQMKINGDNGDGEPERLVVKRKIKTRIGKKPRIGNRIIMDSSSIRTSPQPPHAACPYPPPPLFGKCSRKFEIGNCSWRKKNANITLGGKNKCTYIYIYIHTEHVRFRNCPNGFGHLLFLGVSGGGVRVARGDASPHYSAGEPPHTPNV